MQRIPLYQAKEVAAYALVDDEDYAVLSRYRWHLTDYGYARRCAAKKIDGGTRPVLMHRQILGLEHGNPLHTDHINFNRIDNRRENLKACTQAENNANVSPQRSGWERARSAYRGVWFSQGKWQAGVRTDGKYHNAGRFEDEWEAAKAAWRVRRELWPDRDEPMPEQAPPRPVPKPVPQRRLSFLNPA